MNPAVIALIMGLVEMAIKYEPVIQKELSDILSKKDPTPEDWAALKARVLATPFESLAPDAKLA